MDRVRARGRFSVRNPHMKWQFMAALMAITPLELLVQDVPLSSYLPRTEHDRIVTSLERDAFVLAAQSEESLKTPGGADYGFATGTARSNQAAGGTRVVIVGSHTLKQELLYVAVPVYSGNEIVGAVRPTYPAQVVTNAVNDRLRLLGIVALTTVLLAEIVGFIFSSTVDRKLKLLQHVTERLAEGELHIRADEKTGAPELRMLSRSFKTMSERLRTLIEQLRTFAADASHRLRPLSPPSGFGSRAPANCSAPTLPAPSTEAEA